MRKFTPIVLLVMWACLSPFEPQTSDYDSLLVVDALLTDAPGPYQVKLSYSYGFEEEDNEKPVYVNGASVSVIDENGSVYKFNQSSDGIYLSDLSFRGEVGKRYKLSIIANENTYESDYELLKACPPIDKLYANFETKNGTDGTVYGFQVYVDSNDPTAQTQYYRWDYKEAWEIRSPFYTDEEWVGTSIVPLERLLYTCYVDDYSKNILINNTRGLTEDRISEQKLNYISTLDEGKLNIRYGMYVKQYALDEEAYNFWKDLKEITESSGSLFDKQPFQVLGNIKNTNVPNEPVLGIFEVSGTSSAKVFFSLDDIPEGEEVNKFNTERSCYNSIDTVLFENVDEANYLGNLENTMYVSLIYDETGLTAYAWRFAPANCVDCRRRGGNLDPPIFWEE
ncbi:DUF4249 domain-containing protein [Flammeovirgaceae bacterium SG7u.111]|nr:DUF4249 domain-containing protein [Flammeovirgaceae bacterium SG7u.132]WPO36585.1 DUF4249 domain-containing protein [Flammeovirgaceae bacterium SG7u.111]